MSKLIELIVAASALIVLISAGLLYAAEQEKLEQELNEAAEGGPDEVERILKTVPEDERDTVEVDGLTVNQILSFRDTSCGFDDLAIIYRIIRVELPLSNRGVSKFVNFYMDERKKSCGEKFHDSLKEAVAGFKTEDVKKVKQLNRQRSIPFALESWAKMVKFTWGKDKCFPICVDFIEKLSAAMSFKEWKTVDFDEKQLKFINDWYDRLETCKIYTEIQCKNEPHRLDPARETGFANIFGHYDQVRLCDKILSINESDRTKEKQENRKVYEPKYKFSMEGRS